MFIASKKWTELDMGNKETRSMNFRFKCDETRFLIEIPQQLLARSRRGCCTSTSAKVGTKLHVTTMFVRGGRGGGFGGQIPKELGKFVNLSTLWPGCNNL